MQRRLGKFSAEGIYFGAENGRYRGRRFGPERAEAVKKGQRKLAFFAPFAA